MSSLVSLRPRSNLAPSQSFRMAVSHHNIAVHCNHDPNHQYSHGCRQRKKTSSRQRSARRRSCLKQPVMMRIVKMTTTILRRHNSSTKGPASPPYQQLLRQSTVHAWVIIEIDSDTKITRLLQIDADGGEMQFLRQIAMNFPR